MLRCEICGAEIQWEHVCNAYCDGDMHADVWYFSSDVTRRDVLDICSREMPDLVCCMAKVPIVLSAQDAPEVVPPWEKDVSIIPQEYKAFLLYFAYE